LNYFLTAHISSFFTVERNYVHITEFSIHNFTVTHPGFLLRNTSAYILMLCAFQLCARSVDRAALLTLLTLNTKPKPSTKYISSPICLPTALRDWSILYIGQMRTTIIPSVSLT